LKKLLKILITSLFVAFTITLIPCKSATTETEVFRKLGMDISVYDEEVDFVKAKANGIEFVMIRSSFWNKKDQNFDKNIEEAKKANLPVGVYHYVYAENSDEVKEEAAAFIDAIKNYKLEYPVVIDIEDARYKEKNFTREQITDIVVEMADILEKAGYYVMIYFYKNFAKNYLDMSRINGKYSRWMARWGDDNGGFPKCSPNEEIENCEMWQFTSKGKTEKYGSSGNELDLNLCYKDFFKEIKEKHKNGY